ncbi:Uncharacterised protein [Vibrio cholerae]|nr:Uncharacterised protein [Vibrio cholerae]
MMLSDAVQFILYRYKNRRHLGRKAESTFYRGLRISVASAKQYSHLRASNH